MQEQVNRLNWLEHLLALCRKISEHQELDPILQSIIQAASELTGSESSSILIYEQGTRSLRFRAIPVHLMKSVKLISVPLERSVAGWVFRNRKPMVLGRQHSAEDPIYRVVDRELSAETRTLLAVPMVVRGRTIGVLETVNKQNDADYTEEDVKMVEILAALAAIAIEGWRLQDEAQKAQKAAQEAEQMKTNFVAVAFHELRTPLGVILGQAALLQDSLPPEQRQSVESILNSALQLRSIIEQFATVEALEQGLHPLHYERVAIAALAQRIVESFQFPAAEKGVKITLRPCRADLLVECDEQKIGMALENLVRNAITFTNPGGLVLVKIEELPRHVRVSVMDNGIGIPPGEREKIFQRFYQVEKHLTRRHGGMGLGLSIAREMIELHGGRIWVESVEGKGSNFTFELPQKTADR
jgi:signal transduction histidine kinase